MRKLIDEAAVRRSLDIEAIDLVLSRHRRRGAPLLRRLLRPWRKANGKTQKLRSRLEARLLRGLIERGLPLPETNVTLDLAGERLEVDLLWKEERLAIETDGEEAHGTATAFQRDRRRDQILVAAGYRVSRVTWDQLDEEPEAIFARIRRALKRWAPTPSG